MRCRASRRCCIGRVQNHSLIHCNSEPAATMRPSFEAHRIGTVIRTADRRPNLAVARMRCRASRRCCIGRVQNHCLSCWPFARRDYRPSVCIATEWAMSLELPIGVITLPLLPNEVSSEPSVLYRTSAKSQFVPLKLTEAPAATSRPSVCIATE